MKWAVIAVVLVLAVHSVFHLYKTYAWDHVRGSSIYLKALSKKIDLFEPDMYKNLELSPVYAVELPFYDEQAYQDCDYDAAWSKYIAGHIEFVRHARERARCNRRRLAEFDRTVGVLDSLRIKTKMPFGPTAYCKHVEDRLAEIMTQSFRHSIVTDFEIDVTKALYVGGSKVPVREESRRYGQAQVSEALEQFDS